MPAHLAMPLQAALARAAQAPGRDWPGWLYALVGRADLASQADSHGIGAVDWHRLPLPPPEDGVRTKAAAPMHTDAVAAAALAALPSQGAWSALKAATGPAALAAPPVSDGTDLAGFAAPLLLFPADRRVHEVARLLSSMHPVALRPINRPELSDHDLQAQYQQALRQLVLRPLAAPVGRALFTLATAPAESRFQIGIPDLVRSCGPW